MRMRIGELAARAGTTTRTLRYYEARGLLPARRTGNGYRDYDESDLRLLRQIRTLQVDADVHGVPRRLLEELADVL
ncbi:hypothetical protein GCM10010383_76320 [Streptomyces lomondensis]|uniref:HTH merR-type domain-containing protein n=1 Tax=Streptomyces lomondensis TaxID=68229 RepID=A0ABQ2XVE4_9ACTN|nr:hypothetical protein GCM10010383_76320 [Streptomyces lomondensis]